MKPPTGSAGALFPRKPPHTLNGCPMRAADNRRSWLLKAAACATLMTSVLSLRPRGAVAQDSAEPTPLLTIRPGDARVGSWQEQTLRNVTPNQFAVVADGSRTVLRITSQGSASSLVFRLGKGSGLMRTPAETRPLRLLWSWRTSAFPKGAMFGEKAGDDFAGRVYVMFDYPIDKVPGAQRWLLRLVRAIYGEDVPVAVLCYVWDEHVAADTLRDSPFTSRVKMVVVQRGGPANVWHSVQRDVYRDFQRAFGAEYGAGMPEIRAVALAADTDQTGSSVESSFGDLKFGN